MSDAAEDEEVSDPGPTEHGATALTTMAVSVTILVAGFVLYIGKFVLLPLVIAMSLCSMARPLIDRMNRFGIPWGITVTGLMVLLVVLLGWGWGILFDNAVTFLRSDAVAVTVDGETSVEPSPETLPTEVSIDDLTELSESRRSAEALETVLRDAIRDIREDDFDPKEVVESIRSVVPRVLTYFVSVFGVLLGAINQVFLVLFFMMFIFAEQNVSMTKILAAAGERKGEVSRVMSAIARDVNRYLVVKTGVSVATGVTCMVGLWLLGVPYAMLFGLLAFLLNYIPVFGSILAAIFPAVVAIGTAPSLVTPGLVLVLYLSVNVLFGNVIEPRVLGRTLNLSPLVILICVLVWSALWGVAGMFLAVPMTRVIQLIFANIQTTRPIAILMSNGEVVD